MCSSGDGPVRGGVLGSTMRRLAVFFLLFATLFAAPPAFARGGQSADDCPPASKDPDCAK